MRAVLCCLSCKGCHGSSREVRLDFVVKSEGWRDYFSILS